MNLYRSNLVYFGMANGTEAASRSLMVVVRTSLTITKSPNLKSVQQFVGCGEQEHHQANNYIREFRSKPSLAIHSYQHMYSVCVCVYLDTSDLLCGDSQYCFSVNPAQAYNISTYHKSFVFACVYLLCRHLCL